MIRPSRLQLAEKCGLSARLAEQFPGSSPAGELGIELHRQIAEGLLSGGKIVPSHAGAEAAVCKILDSYSCDSFVECALTLFDRQGEEITTGTADLVIYPDTGPVLVIDHKTGRPENVPYIGDNLQLHTYGRAAAERCGRDSYTVQIMFVGDTDANVGKAQTVVLDSDEGREYLRRIVAAANAPSVANRGPHCGKCYQQQHCYAFMSDATAEHELLAITRPGGLTPATAARAVRIYEALKKMTAMADERLKNYANTVGPIVDGDYQWGPADRAGRETGPSAIELRKLGLGKLVRRGSPYTYFTWTKRRQT